MQDQEAAIATATPCTGAILPNGAWISGRTSRLNYEQCSGTAQQSAQGEDGSGDRRYRDGRMPQISILLAFINPAVGVSSWLAPSITRAMIHSCTTNSLAKG